MSTNKWDSKRKLEAYISNNNGPYRNSRKLDWSSDQLSIVASVKHRLAVNAGIDEDKVEISDLLAWYEDCYPLDQHMSLRNAQRTMLQKRNSNNGIEEPGVLTYNYIYGLLKLAGRTMVGVENDTAEIADRLTDIESRIENFESCQYKRPQDIATDIAILANDISQSLTPNESEICKTQKFAVSLKKIIGDFKKKLDISDENMRINHNPTMDYTEVQLNIADRLLANTLLICGNEIDTKINLEWMTYWIHSLSICLEEEAVLDEAKKILPINELSEIVATLWGEDIKEKVIERLMDDTDIRNEATERAKEEIKQEMILDSMRDWDDL